MNSHREIIDIFVHGDITAEALARELGERGGTVRQWRNRNSIPSRAWWPIVEAARRRGWADITVDELARLAHESPAIHNGDVPADAEPEAAE